MAVRKKKKKFKKAAPREKGVRRPRQWDKAVSVAYLRLLGASQEQSATEAGCAKRSIVSWEASPWWPEAQAEARQRWLQGGDAMARRGLLRALIDPSEYAAASKWWADRRIPELSPPRQRTEHTGPDGGPFQTTLDFSGLTDDERAELRRLALKGGSDPGA